MSPFVLDRSLSPLPPFLPPIYLFIIFTVSVAQLWQNFFQLAVAFTCQTTLQLQGISEIKRNRILDRWAQQNPGSVFPGMECTCFQNKAFNMYREEGGWKEGGK